MKAKQVYTVEVIKLLDDTEVTVRPFSIKKNRLAKAKLDRIVTPEILRDEAGEPLLDEDGDEQPYEMTDEEAETLLLDVVEMACASQHEHLQDREVLEDVVDTLTAYEIIKVTTGYDFLEMQARMRRMMERQMEGSSLP